jgi:hypothetical protein
MTNFYDLIDISIISFFAEIIIKHFYNQNINLIQKFLSNEKTLFYISNYVCHIAWADIGTNHNDNNNDNKDKNHRDNNANLTVANSERKNGNNYPYRNYSPEWG